MDAGLLRLAITAGLGVVWAALVVYAMPAVFRTRTLSMRGAWLLLGAVASGWLAVFVAGLVLDWLWMRIGWSPQADPGRSTLDAIGLALYAIVPVYAFWKRLGVGIGLAVLLAGLWLVLVSLVVAALWLYAAPALSDGAALS